MLLQFIANLMRCVFICLALHCEGYSHCCTYWSYTAYQWNVCSVRFKHLTSKHSQPRSKLLISVHTFKQGVKKYICGCYKLFHVIFGFSSHLWDFIFTSHKFLVIILVLVVLSLTYPSVFFSIFSGGSLRFSCFLLSSHTWSLLSIITPVVRLVNYSPWWHKRKFCFAE